LRANRALRQQMVRDSTHFCLLRNFALYLIEILGCGNGQSRGERSGQGGS
jgi:hypothetical protein